MSTIKSNNHQVGQSATANQNFTLYQPTVPDGTVRLGVGNSGATTADALTVTNAGNATLLGNLTVSGAGTSTVAGNLTVTGTLNATTALQSGGVAAERFALSSSVATTSGTSVGITGIPSWVTRITVRINGVTVSAGGLTQIQIGSGSYTTTGYTSANAFVTGAAISTQTATSGFMYASDPAVAQYGFITLVLVDASTNRWAASWTILWPSAPRPTFGSGYVALGGTLDRLQLNCTGSGGNYNAGSFSLIYEG